MVTKLNKQNISLHAISRRQYIYLSDKNGANFNQHFHAKMKINDLGLIAVLGTLKKLGQRDKAPQDHLKTSNFH